MNHFTEASQTNEKNIRKKCKMSRKCGNQFEVKFPLIRNLHRAVNRQPGYPRETRKAKLKILQKVLRNVQKNIHLSL